MKTYAVFLFDDDKEGFERHTYLKDVETELPEVQARLFFDIHISTATIKVATLDLRITINGTKFKSHTTAYVPFSGGKAIVLAER